MNLTIDYNEQMLNYYPEVIKAIREFQALIKVQSLEVEEMHVELVKLLENAYVGTADVDTITKWERMLGITPLEQGTDSMETWLSDRRETILARLYNVEKLNTKSINDIIKIFTGGTAISYFRDGTITVLIQPPRDNKQYKFENVEGEISKKIPAHLGLSVKRNYATWGEIKENFTDWGAIKNLANWNELRLYIAPQ